MITCLFEDGNQTSLRHAVVDTIVIKEEKILLVKRSEKLSLEAGKWTLPGGFVDRDETLQQAAVRETCEETGYTLQGLQLLTIIDNPNRRRDDRQNIAFIFFGNALEEVQKPDWEVSEVRWFTWEELPTEEEIAFDHYQNIQLYLKYKRENLPLPILTK